MCKTASVLPKLPEQRPQLLKISGMGRLHRRLHALGENFPDHFAQHAAPMLVVPKAKSVVDDLTFNPTCIADAPRGNDSNESVELSFEPATKLDGR